MADKGNASFEHYKGTTQKTKNGFAWTGKIGFNETALLKPLKRKKPTIYFVNSMSDLFHPDVSDEIRDQIFAIMALCPQHTFQILTKRPDIMRKYITSMNTQNIISIAREFDSEKSAWLNADYNIAKIQIFPLPNVWLGTSVENQKYANERIPDLLATPAAVRFLSCEPLLGPINLNAIPAPDLIDGDTYDEGWTYNALDADDYYTQCYTDNFGTSWTISRHMPVRTNKIDWVIVGGESGKGARPMHPDWVRSIRDQCAETNTLFNFKQWGDWWPHPSFETVTIRQYNNSISYIDIDNGNQKKNPNRHTDQTMRKIGKKQSGRTLDGVIHDAVPQVQS